MTPRPRKATPSKIAARGRRYAKDRDNQALDISWMFETHFIEAKFYSDTPFNQRAYDVARLEVCKIFWGLHNKGLSVPWGEEIMQIIRQARQSQD